jgi:hypothetical protein
MRIRPGIKKVGTLFNEVPIGIFFFSNFSEILDKVRTRPDKNVPSGGTHPSEGANAPGSDVPSVALSTSLRSFLSRQASGSVDYAHSNRQEGTYPRSRG